MSALDQAMAYFPYVFHPITVLGVGVLVLVHHEWARQGADRATLWRRVGAFLGAGALALVPTATYFLATGRGVFEATQGNRWQMDALVAAGLLIASGVTWAAWRRHEWGSLVPGMMEALAAVTAPYAALSPFWNVSGHVVIALLPTLYLTLVDRRFWPTLLVPLVMVPNRIYLGAHTWAQALGGFVLAAAITVGVYWLQADGSLRPGLASTDPGTSTESRG